MDYIRLVLIGLITSLSTSVSADSIFRMRSDGSQTSVPVNLTISNDTAFKVSSVSGFLFGLSVSGSCEKDSSEYVVRIVLKDSEGRSHLVMETYEEICDSSLYTFRNHSEETALLNGIVVDSVQVFLCNAVLHLDTIHYVSSPRPSHILAPAFNLQMSSIRRQQAQAKADLINAYNESHDKLWRACVTELSLMSDEDKRRVLSLSNDESSGGIEYYAGGIFEIGTPNSSSPDTHSRFIEGFDWRARHGKNWITPFQSQGNSGYCTAFSIISCTEALVNLYYNRLINLDLSQEELASCCGTSHPYAGIPATTALNYMMNHGVCDEASYPFEDKDHLQCKSDSITPIESIRIADWRMENFSTEDSIKCALIRKGPLAGGYQKRYGGHRLAIIGYDVIHEGDTFCIHNGTDIDHTLITVQTGDERIGKTYWKMKNSESYPPYGGYIYILFNDISKMREPYSIQTPIESINYTDSDILCEDADGDGYYFWGIGPKPAHAPNGIPDEPDGDDSSADYGPMNKYGYLKVLNPSVATTIMVNDSVTADDTEYLYNHIQVNNNGVLTVETDTEFWGELKLTVKSGGTFIVDGIVIDNVELSMESGSHLIVKNGGTLKLRSGKSFYAPTGAIVDISSGNILP